MMNLCKYQKDRAILVANIFAKKKKKTEKKAIIMNINTSSAKVLVNKL